MKIPVKKRPLSICDLFVWIVPITMMTTACQPTPPAAGDPAPPLAAQRPYTLTLHGENRDDPWYWLRDDARTAPEVLAYLEAENAYTQARMADEKTRQETLYQELASRIKPDDSEVPYRLGHAWYATRYIAGKELPQHVRWLTDAAWPAGEPEVLLDENELGAGLDFYQVGTFEVSPDDRWLAWSEDTQSRGIYRLRFRDLSGAEEAAEVIEMASPAIAFAADNRTVFYVRLQDETLIPWQVWRHRIGSDPAEDVLVLQEDDPAFYTTVSRSRDGRWIEIVQDSTLTSEMHVIPATQPERPAQSVAPRRAGHEYTAEVSGENVYLLSNLNTPNFRLVRYPLGQGYDPAHWEELVAGRPDVLLHGMHVLENHVAIEEIEQGTMKIRVVPLDGGESFHLAADEAAYVARLDNNPEAKAPYLRYRYESPAVPPRIYDVDLASRERTLRKQSFAGDDFDAARYQVTRLDIAARDGTAIPVTLLHRAGADPHGRHPLYLSGYGAYGISYLPNFRPQVLSLVDRGFVSAIAHIRGGQELGRAWYEAGKLLNKRNTFTDFIAVARGLAKIGWADPGRIAGAGRSAGGLLIGAVANMAPETFKVLIAGVPFVDVITTMSDESIPLTTFEYDEWGNPADPEYYRYMMSYSPYDNVAEHDYPNMLVTTGLWDPAVQYWEPAKWVAKLRHTKTGDQELLFRIDMSAGHRGGAGRYERLRDTALEYAFILKHIAGDD